MKYKINDVTPEEMNCLIGACPAIYEGLRETTPENMGCILSSCPSVYEATGEGNEVYLIVGKSVAPAEAGLEKRVGVGEALIEVPRALIDNRRK